MTKQCPCLVHDESMCIQFKFSSWLRIGNGTISHGLNTRKGKESTRMMELSRNLNCSELFALCASTAFLGLLHGRDHHWHCAQLAPPGAFFVLWSVSQLCQSVCLVQWQWQNKPGPFPKPFLRSQLLCFCQNYQLQISASLSRLWLQSAMGKCIPVTVHYIPRQIMRR